MIAMMIEHYRRWLARLPPQIEEGAATAEFAVVLPSVIAIVGLILALGRVVMVTMNCNSAASSAARTMIVSNDEGEARRIAAQVVDDDVAVMVQRSEQTVRVLVTCPVLPGPMNLTPVQITAESTAMVQ